MRTIKNYSCERMSHSNHIEQNRNDPTWIHVPGDPPSRTVCGESGDSRDSPLSEKIQIAKMRPVTFLPSPFAVTSESDICALSAPCVLLARALPSCHGCHKQRIDDNDCTGKNEVRSS
jgi:hypothetical protein